MSQDSQGSQQNEKLLEAEDLLGVARSCVQEWELLESPIGWPSSTPRPSESVCHSLCTRVQVIYGRSALRRRWWIVVGRPSWTHRSPAAAPHSVHRRAAMAVLRSAVISSFCSAVR